MRSRSAPDFGRAARCNDNPVIDLLNWRRGRAPARYGAFQLGRVPSTRHQCQPLPDGTVCTALQRQMGITMTGPCEPAVRRVGPAWVAASVAAVRVAKRLGTSRRRRSGSGGGTEGDGGDCGYALGGVGHRTPRQRTSADPAHRARRGAPLQWTRRPRRRAPCVRSVGIVRVRCEEQTV